MKNILKEGVEIRFSTHPTSLPLELIFVNKGKLTPLIVTSIRKTFESALLFCDSRLLKPTKKLALSMRVSWYLQSDIRERSPLLGRELSLLNDFFAVLSLQPLRFKMNATIKIDIKKTLMKNHL